MLKFNNKIIPLMIFFILVIVSISAVNAADTNETTDVNVENDYEVINPSVSNNVTANVPSDISDYSFCNISYTSGISSNTPSGISLDSPTIELSLKSTGDDFPKDNYVDLLVENNGYYLDVNNKNHLYLNSNAGFKDNYANNSDRNLMDIIAVAKNNNLILNLNLLDVSQQEVNLPLFDNLAGNILKFFISIFNIFF